ncbi:permease [Hyphomicrobium methylovorum]|uniref:sulfite exporter TauE/SafE family protein n=1 Tax=Hyphomicrobium methylovorum TaxID=84 RepID=UPI0015E79040|nr:sulfite exporter TauE/SafE family protein [Hyphomicrobium methylovorum]MBA2125526.1 permease [Hyphomicrobium methylovorum]
MTLYLPIAEMPVSVGVYLALGAAVGFMSGLFGVGGGFLLTPLLTFLGIPPAVAVATCNAHVVASSVSGAVTHYRRNNVDVKMGTVMLSAGVVGTIIGVEVVRLLRKAGMFELVVSLAYVTFLGAVGTLILIEGLQARRRSKATGGSSTPRKSGQHSWVDGLPFKMRFQRSKLYISAVPAVVIGMFVGFLSAIMGLGGGFILIPAMIYILRMPTAVVVGTSLFQIVFTAAVATVLHATQNNTVDIVLAAILLVGGVIGAQVGTMAGDKLRGEEMRILLGVLVVIVAIRMGFDLVAIPSDLYSLGSLKGS